MTRAALLALALLLVPARASAYVDVARCVVGEVGWAVDKEARLIVRILAYRAASRGMTPDHLARQYCEPLREPEARPWVAALPAPGESWPEALLPRRYLLRWRRVREAVRVWLREGPAPVACGAIHWAAKRWTPSDRLEIVDCGPTRNLYYRRRENKP